MKKNEVKLERLRLLAEHAINWYGKVVSFNYNFIVFLGVIAGFGFSVYASDTNSTKIYSLPLFFLGEILILVSAFLILLRTREYFLHETINLFSGLLNNKEKITQTKEKKKHDPLKIITNKIKNVLPMKLLVSSFIGIGLLLISFIDLGYITTKFMKIVNNFF